jgi:NADPH-dependent 2,4-dienoyl-CoA reductase/sulfur reductase-like enzyme
VGKAGGYLADETGRLAPSVWAAGDCCEARHRITGEFVFIPLGTHANKQGRVVGENLTGGDVTFDGVLGTAITRFVAGTRHVEVSRVGLSTAEAEAAGIEVASMVTEGRTASGYMPEARPMATKVLAEPGTRRLLGLQIVGGQGSGKRIDTAAAALWGGLTVDDLAGMDLAYAPPFATVWEAVQLAGRRLADRI